MASNKDGNTLAGLLSAEQVAEHLNVSRDLVYLIGRRGDIPCIRIGTGAKARVLFDPDDVQRYIESRRSCGRSDVAQALSHREEADTR
jgi:excisionase family DNA binding protein